MLTESCNWGSRDLLGHDRPSSSKHHEAAAEVQQAGLVEHPGHQHVELGKGSTATPPPSTVRHGMKRSNPPSMSPARASSRTVRGHQISFERNRVGNSLW